MIIGILKQAGNARTQTDIEGEKEIINLAVFGAMNKSKYGHYFKEIQFLFRQIINVYFVVFWFDFG